MYEWLFSLAITMCIDRLAGFNSNVIFKDKGFTDLSLFIFRLSFAKPNGLFLPDHNQFL